MQDLRQALYNLLVKISAQDLLDHPMSTPQRERCDRPKVTSWQAQNDERVPWAISQEPFCMEIYRENAGRVARACVLCEPAQSKCTRTFHNSHVVRKFKGKMPNATDTTSIEHRAVTPTVGTPQCRHTVWGNKTCSIFQALLG